MTANRGRYFGGGFLRQVADGNVIAPAMAMVHDGTAVYRLVADTLSAETLVPKQQTVENVDRKGRTKTVTKRSLEPLWDAPVAEPCSRGVRRGRLTLVGEAARPRACTVRLHFLEPDGAEPGERVFDVWLQGKEVLSGARDHQGGRAHDDPGEGVPRDTDCRHAGNPTGACPPRVKPRLPVAPLAKKPANSLFLPGERGRA